MSEENKSNDDMNKTEGPVHREGASAGNDIEENKIWAAIAYLGILSLVVLLAKKDSPFAQYHAKQGLVLFIATIILGWIPLIGWMLAFVNIVFMVLGIMNAVQGKQTPLPLYGTLADKINL
jgi:uncharacterized membrane protein